MAMGENKEIIQQELSSKSRKVITQEFSSTQKHAEKDSSLKTKDSTIS